jgi:outer membrane protein assembly factor BamE (lipoprotein component of BamABCDE complex)
MTAKRFWSLAAVALVSAALSPTGFGGPDPGQPRVFSPAILARITPGRTTRAEVEKLLGMPWRTIFADDQDEPGPTIWEYRGRDANGTYLVHIEFDGHGRTTLFAKIPDATGEAAARVAAPPPAASGKNRSAAKAN